MKSLLSYFKLINKKINHPISSNRIIKQDDFLIVKEETFIL